MTCGIAVAAPQPLTSADFRITPEEKKIMKELGSAVGEIRENGDKSRSVFEKLGLMQSPEILKKWEKWLDEVYSSTPAIEAAILRRVTVNYSGAMAAFDKKFAECSPPVTKDFSWLENLKKAFSTDYVAAHAQEIGSALLSLHMERAWDCSAKERKDLMDAEWQFRSVQEEALKDIVEFYESDALTPAEKAALRTRLATSRTFLDLLRKTGVGRLMFWMGEFRAWEREKRLPPELFIYLRSQPLFSKPFDLPFPDVMDALNALRPGAHDSEN